MNNLTIEELIGIATKDGKAVSNLAEDKTNVKTFLREQRIKDGPVLVPNYVVYYNYSTQWKPAGKKLSKIGFLRKFNVVFQSKRTKDTRYYLLNEGVFDISDEALNEAKRFDKKYRNKIKQKKQRKTSGITEEI